MTEAYLNRIETVVPPHDVHSAFLSFARSRLTHDPRQVRLLARMVERSGIEHRYSCLKPGLEPEKGPVDAGGIYEPGNFPTTAERMRLFEKFAPSLAAQAVEKLELGEDRDGITHLVVSCCTGFSAPGLDIDIIERCGLRGSVERTMIGFMGCYAAINALKVARHIVRSEPGARVLVLNIELCTLHLQETGSLEQILSFLLFGDGCAASIVSADPIGLRLDGFHALLAPNTRGLVTWHIRESGFDMVLSGRLPAAVQEELSHRSEEFLAGNRVSEIGAWAVHPGGRTVLDAVERAFELPADALTVSRDILRRYGNMSSATVMFVLKAIMDQPSSRRVGCAMAFGPGLVAEAMLFRRAA
ncbi:type III polyketide synthase [Methylobacterium soli]|uniref:Type III polyketide synthase n=1 Tax=Methylobacterium soli TaxID=553447 RepID=A0A6L3T6P4_9HYPH|nr:type III polyketide synthase [Methylobacterium soli]KAB1080866.1 type III polyketide synthase [Methylobacterium soli]GJE41634.1 Alpha-pyrone synthesis polyketide synthase-like Pks18 [Methylobacterium soli]